MLDLRRIRSNPEEVLARLRRRNPEISLARLLSLDEERRRLSKRSTRSGGSKTRAPSASLSFPASRKTKKRSGFLGN
jgi:seryl-tRNA synthetase